MFAIFQQSSQPLTLEGLLWMGVFSLSMSILPISDTVGDASSLGGVVDEIEMISGSGPEDSSSELRLSTT